MASGALLDQIRKSLWGILASLAPLTPRDTVFRPREAEYPGFGAGFQGADMRRALPIFVVLGLSLAGPLTAGVAPNGPEFQVNTYTTSHQADPAIGVRGTGGFVVAWSSLAQDGFGSGIFGQTFDSGGNLVGSEFQVNTYTTNYQRNPAVAMNGAGDFVVAWNSYAQDGSIWGVFGQRFDSGGGPVGSEFQLNTYTTNYQVDPAVGMNGAGDFVVVWSSLAQDGHSWGVFGQAFDSGGSPVGSEFQVNTYTANLQGDPAIAVNVAGDFVVAWNSQSQDGSSLGVFGQMFDSGGSPVGAEFQVNTYTTSAQYGPAVGMSGAGGFVVAWTSYSQDGSGRGVFGQTFDSGGSPFGSEFQVNTHTANYQRVPAIAVNVAGDFVVAWRSDAHDGSDWGIFGQMFESGGSPVGGEFQVNTYTTSAQYGPAVVMSGAGDFVAAWTSATQDGYGYGVFAQRGVTNGPALGSPAPGGTVDCSDPALSRPTFTWDEGDYDKFKVFMGASRGFEKGTVVSSGDQTIVTGSWSPSKKKWKSACNKAITLAADPNNPVMYIGIEGQDTNVPKSDPLRKLLSFPVRTAVQP